MSEEQWVPDSEQLTQIKEDMQSAVAQDFWELGQVLVRADYPPPDGWMPEDFPAITIDHVPYTSNPLIRADPDWRVMADGWLYIETGGHRIAFPDREEWQKFKRMGDCTWNDYERVLGSTPTPAPLDKENPNGDDDEVDPG